MELRDLYSAIRRQLWHEAPEVGAEAYVDRRLKDMDVEELLIMLEYIDDE